MVKKGLSGLLVFLLCLSLIVMLLPGCAPAAPAQGGKPIKIGVLIPYTGAQLPYGPWFENAFPLALDLEGSQIGGRPIQFIYEDDQFAPEPSAQKAKKLVEQDQVDAIIGTLNGGSTMAVAGYLKGIGTPFAPLVEQSVAAVRQGGNNTFLPWGTLRGSAYPLGQYAYDLGYRTTTTIAQDFVAGYEFINGFETGFKSKGGTVIQSQLVPLGTLDFAPYLSNLKKADCLGLWLAGTMGPLLKQYYEFGNKMPVCMVTSSGEQMSTLAQLGDNALGMVGQAQEWLESPSGANKKFVEGWAKKYGSLPETFRYSYGAYSSLLTLLDALKKTGGDTTPAKVIEAWKTVKTDTPSGTISFDQENCAIGDIYLFEYSKDGGKYYWKMLKEFKGIPKKMPGE